MAPSHFLIRAEGSAEVQEAIANASDPATTIGFYSHGLNGVDQGRNKIVKASFWLSLSGLVFIILAFRISERLRARLRFATTVSLPGEKQDRWAKNRYGWWRMRKFIHYAPFWKQRHNREIKLGKAGNLGTIPSRLHCIILFLYTMANLGYCVWLDWSDEDRFARAADLRGRSGVLAVVNMVPLIIFAGRNNPLIPILQISFDTYNLFHRWIGRIVVLESFIHTCAWFYVRKAGFGWGGVGESLVNDPFITFGAISTILMILMTVFSLSPVRHAFYEVFLNAHIIMALITFVGLLLHCQLHTLPYRDIVWASGALWLLERLVRFGRILYLNFSTRGCTNASVVPLQGEACRVTLHLPKHINVTPGSHAYLRFGAGLNRWESHPFSIAWVEHRQSHTSSLKDDRHNLPTREKELRDNVSKTFTTTDVSFVIGAQAGMTRKLLETALAHNRPVLNMRATLEGPYGGHHSLDSYGHAVLFAGSSGITHQLPYVRHMVQQFAEGRISTRKITLIWIIRSPEHLDWVRPWMDAILEMPHRRDILTVKVYITRPPNPKAITSPSAKVQMYPCRPDVVELLQEEVREQVGAMCVTVCGPGALADNVREGARAVQHQGSVTFIEESFTW